MKIVLCSDGDWLLSEEAYLLYASCMYQPKYEDFKNEMESLLSDYSVRVYVCEDRGKKTGIMVLKFSNSTAEIIGIATSEKLRHQGMGRHLIQFVMIS